MKKIMLILAVFGLILAAFSACNIVEDVPTVPMATITPTPTNLSSAMPTIDSTFATDVPLLPTETVSAIQSNTPQADD